MPSSDQVANSVLIGAIAAVFLLGGAAAAAKANSKSKTNTKSVYFKDFEKELPSLSGRIVAITGCTSGTGLVAAKTCVRKNAAVVLLLNRPSERATQAEAEIKTEIIPISKTIVETIPCDLQSFESVQAAADMIKSKYGAQGIDILCCNAGIMAVEDAATKDGYDVQMQTNHLSHFLLVKELFGLVKIAQKKRGDARIVHHSSLARHGPALDAKYFQKEGGNLGGNAFGKWQRYHHSKLANAVMTTALAQKLGTTGIKATCAAPGYASTHLQTSSTGMPGMAWTRHFFAQSAADGTMPLLSACLDKTAQNGDFYEPSCRFRTVGPPAKFELEAVCQDEASQKMLWEESEKACGRFTVE